MKSSWNNGFMSFGKKQFDIFLHIKYYIYIYIYLKIKYEKHVLLK
jgi:hypothetical protein